MENHSVHLPWMWAPESDGAGGKAVESPDTIIITRGENCENEVLRFDLGDLVIGWIEAFEYKGSKKIEDAADIALTEALAKRFRELANELDASVLRQ